jgi:hypothetical protein
MAPPRGLRSIAERVGCPRAKRDTDAVLLSRISPSVDAHVLVDYSTRKPMVHGMAEPLIRRQVCRRHVSSRAPFAEPDLRVARTVVRVLSLPAINV